MGTGQTDVTPSAYMLCTSPRSGSTLMCRLLRDTGVAGHPLSYFFESRPAAWAERHGGGPVSEPPSKAELEAVFDAIRDKGRGSGQIFGVRQQAHSNRALFAALTSLYPKLDGDVARLEAVFGPMRFIFLNRADKVAQAVSYLKAEQSGLWHMRADGTELERLSAPSEPVYDRAALSKAVAEFEGYAADWEAWFGANGVTPLRLTYDEVSGSPVEALRRVLSHLELDLGAAKGIEPSVAKLADQTSLDWIARYRSGN